MVKGTAAKSSAIASREFLDDESVLFNGCDQTAFRCSGSGCRDGDSLTENDRGDFVHGLTEAEGGGVMITRSSGRSLFPESNLPSVDAGRNWLVPSVAGAVSFDRLASPVAFAA